VTGADLQWSPCSLLGGSGAELCSGRLLWGCVPHRGLSGREHGFLCECLLALRAAGAPGAAVEWALQLAVTAPTPRSWQRLPEAGLGRRERHAAGGRAMGS